MRFVGNSQSMEVRSLSLFQIMKNSEHPFHCSPLSCSRSSEVEENGTWGNTGTLAALSLSLSVKHTHLPVFPLFSYRLLSSHKYIVKKKGLSQQFQKISVGLMGQCSLLKHVFSVYYPSTWSIIHIKI